MEGDIGGERRVVSCRGLGIVGPHLSPWNHAILRGGRVKYFRVQGWDVCDTVDD